MQAGLEAQRVARAEPDRLDRRMRQQPPRQRHRAFARHRDLEAIVAGVAGTADEPVAEGRGLHETQSGDCRLQRRERGFRRRALERDQRPVEQLEREPGTKAAQQLEVLLPAAGIDDDAHLVAEPRDHEIVLDAAALVEQQRIALHARAPAVEIERQRALERLVEPPAGHAQLPHVRDVEEPRLGASVQVLGAQPLGILQRHLVARERAEACPQLTVKRM